jgi:hypothetical protein
MLHALLLLHKRVLLREDNLTLTVYQEALCVVQLDLSSKKLSTLSVSVSSFQKDVEKVVATAYSAALAGAYNYNTEKGCIAWVNAGGCIWTEGHPDEKTYCAGCAAVAYSEGAVGSIDAIAEAGASSITGGLKSFSSFLGRDSCDDSQYQEHL